jgi:3-phenylpropionate/trans-cinnamate dioxygenase ferredoxin reductase subunit
MTISAAAYARLPYFFSDQYDLGMEYVGHGDPDDAVVVRGSLADREFIAFWHRDGAVTAAMNVNVWDVAEDLEAIVAGGRVLEPDRLADPTVPPRRARMSSPAPPGSR